MPYKSEAQRRYFNVPENRNKLEEQGVDVDEWNESSKGKKLPEKVKEKKANLNPLVNMPNMSGMYSQMSQIARQPNMMGTGPASNYQPSQATSDMNQLIHTTNQQMGYNPLGTGMRLNRQNPYSMVSPQQRQQAENMSRQMDKQFNPYGTGMGFNGGLGGGLNGSSVGGNYGQAAGTNAAAVPGANQMKLGAEQLTIEKLAKLVAARCWEGYEPVPGKKPYSDGSCQPKGEKSKAKEKKASLGSSAVSGLGSAIRHGFKQLSDPSELTGRAGLGALLGGGIGAVGGALFPGQYEEEDEYGQKNPKRRGRLEAALRFGGLGALTGGGLGLGSGISQQLRASLGSKPQIAPDPKAKLKESVNNLLDSLPIPKAVTDYANSAEKRSSVGKLLAGGGIGGLLGTMLGRYTGYNKGHTVGYDSGYGRGSAVGGHETLMNLLKGMQGVVQQGSKSDVDLNELVNKQASSGCSCGAGGACQCGDDQNNRASKCSECGEVNCNCQKSASTVALLGKMAAVQEKMAFRLLPGRRQQQYAAPQQYSAPQQYAAPQQQAPGYASVNDFQRPTGPLPSDRSASGAAAWQPAPQGMTRMRNDVTGDVFYAPSVEAGRQYMGDAASAAKLGIKPGQRVDQGYQQQMDASRQRAMSPPSVSPATGAASRGMGLGLSAIGKGITGLAQSAGQGVVAAGRYGNEALEASRRAQQTNAMQMKRNEPVVGPITGTTAAEKAQAASPVGNTGTIYDTYKGYDARTGAHAPKPAPAAPYRPVGGGRNY